jgi:hypothetical protein
MPTDLVTIGNWLMSALVCLRRHAHALNGHWEVRANCLLLVVAFNLLWLEAKALTSDSMQPTDMHVH